MNLENVDCNYCGSNKYKILFNFGEMNIVQCRVCGLKYTNPRLKNSELVNIYNRDYYQNHELIFKQKERYYGYYDYLNDMEEIVKAFEKKLQIIEKYKKGGRILDVGCALGFFLDLVRSRGWNVQGIEISRYAVEYAREKMGLNVKMKTLLESNFPEEHFDVISMWDVLEHVPSPMEILVECSRILKKNGLIAISVPDAGRPIVKLLGRHWAEYKRIKEHNYFFDRNILKKMLEKAGFKVLEITSVGRFFNIPSLLNELKVYNYSIFNFLVFITKKMGLSYFKFYIKPGYKTAIYAKKK